MGEEDVKNTGSTSGSDSDLDDKHQRADADSDMSDGDKSGEPKQIPYARFKEVIEQSNGLKKVVDFFRSHIETPEDLIAFKEYKQKMLDKAQDQKDEGEISAAQLAKFKKAMELANPELAAIAKSIKEEKEAKMDAQFDEAEDQIRELCASNNFPKDEKVISRIAVHVMDEIRSDEKLLRMWQAGNMKCVDKAFKAYNDEYLSIMRKGDNGNKGDKMLAEKRRIMRMPALPSGKSGNLSGAPERKAEDKGLTKQAHEDAWAVFQSHMND